MDNLQETHDQRVILRWTLNEPPGVATRRLRCVSSPGEAKRLSLLCAFSATSRR